MSVHTRATAQAATVAAGALAMTAGLIAMPSQAVAAECEEWYQLCGRLINRDNARSVRITNDWPGRNSSSTWRNVAPGRTGADAGVRDTDGLYVPSGCTVTLAWVNDITGPGWVKIRGGQYIQVTDVRC